MQNDIVKRPVAPTQRNLGVAVQPRSGQPATQPVTSSSEPASPSSQGTTASLTVVQPPGALNTSTPAVPPKDQDQKPNDVKSAPPSAQREADNEKLSGDKGDQQPQTDVAVQPKGPTAPVGIIVFSIVVCLSLVGLALYAGLQQTN